MRTLVHVGSGELVASAKLTFVLLDQQSGQVIPMEGEWAERLGPLVVDVAETK